MKKIKLLLLSCLFIFASSYAFSENAIVSYVRGKAEVCRNDIWIQLKNGDLVYPSETISTGFQSELKIQYNNSVMALGALTRITLDELSSSSEKDAVSVYLNTGAVRSRVSHQDSKRVSYTMKSPVAVASVRGTDFLMTGNGTVSCMEGAVAVYVNTDNKRDGMGRSTEEKTKQEESSSEETSSSSESSSKESASTTTSSTSKSDSSDYVPANATTPANEIYEPAPAGAIVVAQNQQVSVLKTGMIEKPADNTEKQKSRIINAASTALTTESVTIGTVTSNPLAPVIAPPARVQTPTELNVKVKLSE